MTLNADSASSPLSPSPDPTELPDTNDPVVLRELLRQAREHLRLRESIEQLMADNVARTEALLVEARAARQPGAGVDREALSAAVTAVRVSLQDALAAAERLDTLLAPAPAKDAASVQARPCTRESVAIDTLATPPADSPDAAPHTIELLMHQVHTPALARSAQQHLLNVEGVTSAEVRELAEGLLRITVVSTRPLVGDDLAAWETDRPRTVRTSSADVLELVLEPDDD